MADFVLVHGAWHGGWCWRRIVPALFVAGHRAFAPTLTGLGERAHLMAPSITLATHVDDVVNLIESEELDQVILVGHSYGGLIITGVADRLPTRVTQLVYVDALVPAPGECWSSGHDLPTRESRRRAIADLGYLPAPDPAAYGLAGADHAWVARRQTRQPGRLYDEPLVFDAGRIALIPRTFIDCVAPALPTIEATRRRVRTEGGWNLIQLNTGHDPMISAPNDLLAAFLQLA